MCGQPEPEDMGASELLIPRHMTYRTVILRRVSRHLGLTRQESKYADRHETVRG